MYKVLVFIIIVFTVFFVAGDKRNSEWYRTVSLCLWACYRTSGWLNTVCME